MIRLGVTQDYIAHDKVAFYVFHSFFADPRMNAGCIQLFQGRLSEKVQATILKGIVVDFEFTVFKETSKNGKRSHGRMSAKRKQQK